MLIGECGGAILFLVGVHEVYEMLVHAAIGG
jgi:hypothetical protein